MELEIYSDELVKLSDTYHRLGVDICLIEYSLYDHLPDLLESSEIFVEGIDDLKKLRKEARDALVQQLKNESSICFEITGDYEDGDTPTVNCPYWLSDLFSMCQCLDTSNEILNAGGVLIHFEEGIVDQVAIPKEVPESFMRVWWGFIVDGYLKRSNQGWLAVSLER